MGPCLREAIFKGELDIFPALLDQQQQQIHEPLPFDFFKEIRKTARGEKKLIPFLRGLTDSLATNYDRTPWDWRYLCKTVLGAPQCLV